MKKNKTNTSSFFVAAVLFGGLIAPAAFGAPLEQAVSATRQDIENQSRALNQLREQISRERTALVQEVQLLESETASLREKAASFRHAKWYRDAGFDQLKDEAEYLNQEVDYASSLIVDFRRSMVKRMHGAETQRFEEAFAQIDGLLDAREKGAALRAFIPVLDVARRRNAENWGGHAFSGKAADQAGVLHAGQFILVGPAAYFVSDNGKLSGLASVSLGSLYPAVVHPVDKGDLKKILQGKTAAIPVDVTLGEAVKMAGQKKSLWAHITAGGIVMIPILFLGALSLGIAVMKFLFLGRIRRNVSSALPGIFALISEGRVEEAAAQARSLGSPWGPVLAEGVYHHNISIEHLEEVLHEKTLSQIPYLERNLSILAVSAAASPLLGLLGTVTGMIHTFDLVTVFGTGKANLLSGGISEALITTEYGLLVAIPALLAHAYLSRQVQKILHQLEQMNTAFINGLKLQRFRRFAASEQI